MTTQVRIPEKARPMIRYLQEQIHAGIMKTGNRIPPLRQLQEIFNISQSTAKRGIDYLCAEGMLESTHGAGTFVAIHDALPNPRQATCRIMTLMPWADQVSVLTTVFSGICEAGESESAQVLMTYFGIDHTESAPIRDLSQGCDAVLLLGEYDYALRECNLSIPVITCWMDNTFGGKLSVFDMDPFHSAEIAASYFHKHGRRDVVMLDSGRVPSATRRLAAFSQIWHASGGTASTYKIPTNGSDSGWFQPGKTTGYLFATGCLLNRCCMFIKQEKNINLPNEAVVLGYDGRSLLDPSFIPVPCIAPDWKQVGRDMLREAVYRITHPGATPRRVLYPGTLSVPEINRNLHIETEKS